MTPMATTVALILFSIFSLSSSLSVDYYAKTCPNVDKAVTAAVKLAYSRDKTVPAALLRMHFHDCFADVKDDNYIGRIVEFFEGCDSRAYFTAQWFYRTRDTVIKDSDRKRDAKGLIISEDVNENALDCNEPEEKQTSSMFGIPSPSILNGNSGPFGVGDLLRNVSIQIHVVPPSVSSSGSRVNLGGSIPGEHSNVQQTSVSGTGSNDSGPTRGLPSRSVHASIPVPSTGETARHMVSVIYPVQVRSHQVVPINQSSVLE